MSGATPLMISWRGKGKKLTYLNLNIKLEISERKQTERSQFLCCLVGRLYSCSGLLFLMGNTQK